MNLNSKILVLGHNGLVGSAILRALKSKGCSRLLVVPRSEADLREQVEIRAYFGKHRPEYVFLAAATVGGIMANSTRPADFIYDNTLIAANVLDCCVRYPVRKILMLGSTCIYPKLAPQPIKEESLLSGPLEPTNQWYAIAKIAGIKIAQAFRIQHGLCAIAAMPTNLYGPNDNYDLASSHVLPALIRKIHEAKVTGAGRVEIWGTGTPRREFLHVDDLTRALLLLMETYDDENIINVGCGEDVTILELANIVKEVIGYAGQLYFDTSKPDGTPKKQTDSTRIFSLGWKPQIALPQGIREVYEAYCAAHLHEASIP
ncbi:GDP-L-fucose synthase [bacterium]|nr:GDP-L-fucose synthase [bacterium]